MNVQLQYTDNSHIKNVPSGTVVRLGGAFKTSSGIVYAAGTIGRIAVPYDGGVMIQMPDSKLVPIPFQSVAVRVPLEIVV
jgi:hypothetical protein